jgi:predicted phage tail protein
MIRVLYLKSIMEHDSRREAKLNYIIGKTVREYIEEAGYPLEGHKVILSGKKLENLDCKPRKDDEIIVVPDVKFVVLGAAIVAGFTWAVAHAALIGVLAMVAAYGIYSAMSKPRRPSQGTNSIGGGIDQSSPTYGWDGIQTTQEVGTPIPVIYGEHKVGGNIINSYIRYDGDNNYLNVLIALGEGEIESIDTVTINDNPIENFESVTTDKRYGTNTQTRIPGFEDTHNMYNVGVALPKNSAYTYTTADEDVEALEVHLSCQGGLFASTDTGGMTSASVTYKVEYKLHSSGTWIDLGEQTFSASSRSAIRRVYRIDGLTAGQYDVRITKTSDDSSLRVQCDLNWVQIDEIKTDDLSYPNLALLSVEAMATNQISGSIPNFTCIVKGRKVLVPQVMNGASEVDWEDYYWDEVNEVYKLFSDDTELTWDGVSYVARYSANPIWCVKDFLSNSRYGLGEFISISLMSNAQLAEMANHCEEKVPDGNGGYEKRFRLDVVIDGTGKALDIISQLATVFRGFPFYSAGSVYLKIDKPAESVQMFNMGNIIKDSFVESWKSKKELPNMVEIQYLDKDKDYKQEQIAYVDETAIAAGEPLRKSTMRLFTTRKSQAMREARYALLVAKHIDRMVSFKAMIDAIACQPGDVICLSHDVLTPTAGDSGRVVSGSTTTSVKLDQSVTLASGETYKLRVQFSDDTIEEKTVSTAAGTTDTIEVVGDAFSQAPGAFDKYCLGTSVTVKEDYRIISMSKDSKFEIEITAVLYNDDVYDDTEIDLPEDNIITPDYDTPLVSNLTLAERIYTQGDGSVQSAIDVFFAIPDISGYAPENRYKGANVYIRESATESWNFAGYTERDRFSITQNLVVGGSYYICVTSVMFSGVETDKDQAPNDDITLAGKISAPADVTGFTAVFTDELVLSWSKISDKDLGGFEIRVADSSWGVDNADLVYRGRANSFTFRPATRAPGTYYIKAFNTSLVYSDTAATVTPTNAAPGAPTSLDALVFFNVSKLSWVNVADTDVVFYEVYRSESNAWAGEETLEGRISGKSMMVKSRKPTGGNVVSATNSTVVDSDLIGLGTDFCVGDIIQITTGVNKNEQKTITGFNNSTGAVTISGTWTANPEADDKFVIYDKSYFKVRAVDYYGGGTFTSALAVTFETLTEDSLGDEIITARKVTTGELITLSAQIANALITNAHIADATIESAKIISLDADKVDADQLDAITTNTGTLTVDEYIKAGDNVFIDGTNEVFKVFGDTITIDATNNKIDWLENDGGGDDTYAATLDSDDYTPEDLAAELQAKMRAQGDDNTTVTYSSTTRKITIANAELTTLTLKWSTGTNTTVTCGRALGFDVSADDSGALTYAADEQAALRVELGKLS